VLPAGRHRESSYDSSGKYYLDTPFSSNVAGHFAGGEWRADFNHNQLMAVTNSGQKSTNALLTLHYDNGEKSYEMQQSIQPGDQMWVNVAELIRSRTPDRKGNLLPVDLSYGTFDLRDLTPANDGLLISSVALDMTMGYNATQPCVECCGYLADSPTFDPYPAEVVVDGIEQTGIEAVSGCSDDTSYISSYYATWGSLNPSIAAVTANQVQGVAAGTTTGTATGTIPTPGSCVCTLFSSTPQVPVTVAATPVNFRQTAVVNQGSGVLKFTYEWDSSTGNLDDLSQCQVQELVAYPGGNPFVWPSPPYASGNTTSNPLAYPNPGIPATDGGTYDVQDHPGFQKPYASSDFTASQTFQFSCSNYYLGFWQTFPWGPAPIVRTVQQSGVTWNYTITKSGSSAGTPPP
jgi:hypothetical protein